MELNLLGDEFFMKQALREAEKAYEQGEVPVGAVLVSRDRIIMRAHNQTELLKDVTAHAEILAITGGSNHLQTKYLKDCTLYVTLEPCIMCAGAIAWAQLGRLVFGAYDEKKGFSKIETRVLHPKTEVVGGVLAKDCSLLLKAFFRNRRTV
ncbi:MAG: tRNA adenosine(34) deaminase TadA [Bacteroidota bacterium]